MIRRGRGTACILLGLLALLAGCGGALSLVAYLGGGLPPGETDLGGVVLAAAPSVAVAGEDSVRAQEATAPVEAAQVRLRRAGRIVGETTTGAEGYFRFQNPATGTYQIEVDPPAGSGLQSAVREAVHTRGRQTFVTIILERAPGPGPGGP